MYVPFPCAHRARSSLFVAFAFAYLERLLTSPPSIRSGLVRNSLDQLETTARLLEGVGYEKLVFEDFFDALAQILKQVANHTLTPIGLLEAFNDAPGTPPNSI